jgi:hypothetical protein
VRQSRSRASCAATDSPCAVNTTLQWVVANAIALLCAFLPISVTGVTSSGSCDSSQSQATKQSNVIYFDFPMKKPASKRTGGAMMARAKSRRSIALSWAPPGGAIDNRADGCRARPFRTLSVSRARLASTGSLVAVIGDPSSRIHPHSNPGSPIPAAKAPPAAQELKSCAYPRP